MPRDDPLTESLISVAEKRTPSHFIYVCSGSHPSLKMYLQALSLLHASMPNSTVAYLGTTNGWERVAGPTNVQYVSGDFVYPLYASVM